MVITLLALLTSAQAADAQLSHQGRLVDALGDETRPDNVALLYCRKD